MITLLPSVFTPSDPQVPFYTERVTVPNVAYYLNVTWPQYETHFFFSSLWRFSSR